MKRLFALVAAALVAFAPSLSAQNSTDVLDMLKDMPAKEYQRAYVGYNPVDIKWGDALLNLVGDIALPLNSGFTAGYLKSMNVVKGLPVFVEYGANLQYLFGKSVVEELDEVDYKIKVNNLAVNIPVVASLRLSFMDDKIAVAPYLGLNFRLNLLGKQIFKYGEEKESVSIYGDDEDALGAKRFQAGLNFGLAVSYDVYTLTIGRVSDFTQFAEDGNVRMAVTSISVGYAF